MKKLFIVLAVASLGFVACNNDSETKEVTTDSPVIEAPVAPVVDSPAVSMDTTASADTTKK